MNINHIISKLLNNKASAEELEILEDWKKESEDNLHEINKLIELKKASSELNAYKSYDVEAALTAVENKIGITTHAQTTKGYGQLKKYISILALILIIGTIFLYIYKDKIWVKETTHFNAEFANLDIDLKDGSKIFLDHSSTLDIDDNFLTNRLVSLKGRAFFNVSHIDESAPFIVQIPNVSIKVIGTEFSVFSDGQYAEIAVLSGAVEVSSQNRRVQLTKGEHLLYDDNDFVITKFYNENYYGWSTGLLQYKDAPLKEILEDLEWTFSTRFDTSSIKISNTCRISTKYQNMELNEILEELKSLIGLDFIYKDEVIFVTNINCS